MLSLICLFPPLHCKTIYMHLNPVRRQQSITHSRSPAVMFWSWLLISPDACLHVYVSSYWLVHILSWRAARRSQQVWLRGHQAMLRAVSDLLSFLSHAWWAKQHQIQQPTRTMKQDTSSRATQWRCSSIQVQSVTFCSIFSCGFWQRLEGAHPAQLLLLWWTETDH